jgi:DNA invertase Pin-like site-specific DNA recombinase
LLRIVRELTGRGIAIEFVKEAQTFTGEDSPMAKAMLGMLATFAEFERSMIKERQREGIAIAKAAGKYKGRSASLSPTQAAEVKAKVAAGVPIAKLAREYSVSRPTIYAALKAA